MGFPRVLCLCLFLSGLWFWVPPASAVSGSGDRARFLAAEKALAQGHRDRFETLRAGLSHYPLLPYLDFAALRRDLRKLAPAEVDAFLKRYADTPLAPRLRRLWLRELARRGDWRTYLEYAVASRNARDRCEYLQALIHTGHPALAFKQVPSLWRVGHSQPKACDPVFDAWRRAGGLTPALAWERFALAMEAGQVRLARYLRRFLPRQRRTTADLWLRLRARPAGLAKALAGAGGSGRERLLIDVLGRWARKDPVAAEAAWHELSRRAADWPAETRWRAERAIALGWLRQRRPGLLARLDHLTPPAEDRVLQRKRILAALRAEDWRRVRRWIEALPKKEREREGWRYWYARALERLGDTAGAKRRFAALAKERSFYGFLAAERAGLPHRLAHRPLKVDEARVKALAHTAAAARIRELRALGRGLDARREWHRLTRGLDRAGLQAAARLADRWGWHDQAIFTLARSGYWDDLELRFPLDHQRLAEAEARRHGLEPAWLLAVIRQESAFAADARSRVGATGLMQLMPATAKKVAKKMGRPRPRRADLERPETNIALGSAYLAEVYERLYSNPVLATAAYNAGPHRVLHWLPERTQDADLWMELIPFRETRTYVHRVMAYLVIYQHRLGLKAGPLLARLRPILGRAERAAARLSGEGQPTG